MVHAVVVMSEEYAAEAARQLDLKDVPRRIRVPRDDVKQIDHLRAQIGRPGVLVLGCITTIGARRSRRRRWVAA